LAFSRFCGHKEDADSTKIDDVEDAKYEEEEDDGMLCNKPESPTQMEKVFINPAFPVPKRIFSVNTVNFNAEQGD
jgi:hypothetical protein